MTRYFLVLALAGLLLVPNLGAQQTHTFYSPGDWVTYTNSRYVTAIARGFHTVYFGTTEGILRYDIVRENWLEPLTTSAGMPENRIRRLAVDRLTDEIWIETTNHTGYYNPTFEEWYSGEPFPEGKSQPSEASISQFPQLFVNRGFNYLPGGVLLGSDLLEYRITETLAEDGGVVWVGVWGLGPGRADLRRAALELMPVGPYESDIAALAVVGDDIWMLGGGEGLPGVISHYDRQREEWEYFDPRRNPNIVSDQFYVLRQDSANLWMGTELGLVRYDQERRRFSSYTRADGIYGERVTAILPTEFNIIIGTDVGVSVYDLKRDSIYIATSDNIRGLTISDLDLSGRVIYAATDFGVFALSWGGSYWKRFLPSEAMMQGVVRDIQVVDSVLYAAGDDGVVKYDLVTEELIHYDRNTVFKNADIRVLLVHQGVAWVGGDDGLFRLNNRTDNWYHYRPADGLPSYRVTSLAGDGDFIWIGTDGGATRFYWNERDRSDWKY